MDLDAIEVFSHSGKENLRPTWKKHSGSHPLCATIDIDHGAGLTGERAAVLLRPGSAGANTAGNPVSVFDQARAAAPDYVDRQELAQRLMMRTVATGCSQAFINHLDDLRVAYTVALSVT